MKCEGKDYLHKSKEKPQFNLWLEIVKTRLDFLYNQFNRIYLHYTPRLLKPEDMRYTCVLYSVYIQFTHESGFRPIL